MYVGKFNEVWLHLRHFRRRPGAAWTGDTTM